MSVRLAPVVTGKYAYPIWAPPIALLLLAMVLSTGIFQGLENLTVDWRFRCRAPYDPPADPRVILIRIDQSSLDLLGGWPWNRTIHGLFCQFLASENPSVVALDLLFTEPREAKGDSDLATGFALPRAVISGAEFSLQSPGSELSFGKTRPLTQIEGDVSKIEGSDYALLPIPPLRPISYFASVNVEAGSDGIRREAPMVVRIGREVFPSLSLQMLCQYWKVAPEQVHIRLGRDIRLPTPEGIRSIPINESGKMLLNYRRKETYVSIPYGSLFQRLAEHATQQKPLGSDLPSLENKILLVGETASGLTDLGPSPLEAISPLPLVHMTALNNILRGDYLRRAPVAPVIFAWLIVSWATLFYLREKDILFSILVPCVCVLAYVALALGLFSSRSLLLPMVWPIVFFTGLHAGGTVFRWLEEQKSRRRLKQSFSAYIAPTILERILNHPEGMGLGGVSRPVTMLFSDIRGFSELSENMGEVELVYKLNEYFEKMVGCVNQYHGTLHKYIGDAIMAAWGDILPEKVEVDAAKAVRSALAMRRALIELNATWAAQKRPQLRIGMGLNHGMALVGNIGAIQRREFTVMGDVVNLASRLEGITKQFKTDFVVGESVHELVRDEFLMRTIGVIQVKGKKRAVKVYEVLDDLKAPVGLWSGQWVALYEQAMEAFLSRDFLVAQSLFLTCLEQREGDYCSGRYLKLCQELIAHPPGEDWNGTQVMESK